MARSQTTQRYYYNTKPTTSLVSRLKRLARSRRRFSSALRPKRSARASFFLSSWQQRRTNVSFLVMSLCQPINYVPYLSSPNGTALPALVASYSRPLSLYNQPVRQSVDRSVNRLVQHPLELPHLHWEVGNALRAEPGKSSHITTPTRIR